MKSKRGNHLQKNVDELPDAAVAGFLRLLESVRVQDMPCSEVFTRLDEYVERELRDHEAATLMPLLREHFDVCQDCREEYEALLRALEQSLMRGRTDEPTPDRSA